MDKHLWQVWLDADTAERGDLLVGVLAVLIFCWIIFDIARRYAP